MGWSVEKDENIYFETAVREWEEICEQSYEKLNSLYLLKKC